MKYNTVDTIRSHQSHKLMFLLNVIQIPNGAHSLAPIKSGVQRLLPQLAVSCLLDRTATCVGVTCLCRPGQDPGFVNRQVSPSTGHLQIPHFSTYCRIVQTNSSRCTTKINPSFVERPHLRPLRLSKSTYRIEASTMWESFANIAPPLPSGKESDVRVRFSCGRWLA